MLRQWLIDLRKKPKHVRERVSFIAASTFTAIVFVGWLISSPWQKIENEASAGESNPKIFSTFFNQIKEQVGGLEESLPQVVTASTTEPEQKPVVLSASSTNWTLSSTTVEAKRIEREVPLMIVPTASSAATATAPSSL